MKNAFILPKNFKITQPNTWFRIAQPINGTTKLSRRHVYLLPTRFGWFFSSMLFALLIGSINYSLSLGFAMTFLLTGMGIISMLHSWRNLANLEIMVHRTKSVIAGEAAIFELKIAEVNNRTRYAIYARFAEQPSENAEHMHYMDILALSNQVFKLSLKSQKRGWLKTPHIIFSTRFPVSFFNVWAYAEINDQCLIYPKPGAPSLAIPASHAEGAGILQTFSQGDDDFAGHRHYQYGDSPKRVDWKASNRKQGLLIKQFKGEENSTLWLDYSTTTGEEIEFRISQITRWVVDAHCRLINYGLRLPHISIYPGMGEAHYHQCLKALALM